MKTSKPLSAILFVLALALGLGSIILFALVPLGALRLLRIEGLPTTLLLWDATLSLLFFLQHSGMIRRGFRDWLTHLVGLKYRAALYSIASGIALGVVVLFWQPVLDPLLVLTGVPRYLSYAMSLAAFGFFVWGVRSLRPFDPLGLTPLVAHLRDRPEPAPSFVVRGPYRLVRHPLYLAVLVLIWSCPDMTMDRLLFQVVWSVWILLGARLEEADLLTEFGDVYRAYCREVPMIVPWPKGRLSGRANAARATSSSN